jgi:uncharacterized protein (TIGR03435 family)
MATRWFGLVALACAAWAQPPAFEVASVKMSEPITPELVQSGRLQMGVTIDAHYVRISKLSMLELVSLAYQRRGHQLSVQPWMTMQRYDIQAKLPEGATRGQVPAMVQTLLAQRLGLKTHKENRELKVYALVVAKDGHKLKASPPEDPATASANAAAVAPTGQIRGGLAVSPTGQIASVGLGGDSRVTPGPNGNLHVESKKITMQKFVEFIARYCDLPVLNQTELEGLWDLEVDVSGDEVRNAARSKGVAVGPAPASAADAASDPSGVSLRASLQKLGLRLEGRKMPVEVLVVDDALKVPTEN